MFVKKWPLHYQKVIKTHLPTYLWDSSDSSDSPNSHDSIDSIDSSDSSDSEIFQVKFWVLSHFDFFGEKNYL